MTKTSFSLLVAISLCQVSFMEIIYTKPSHCSFAELKEEIERLKLTQGEGSQGISAKALAEVALLREKLKETQRMLAESTR